MKVAIMQPTYLPWMGYLAMISSVDLFVFLDTPQFAYRSWQQRNRILRNYKTEWLTVPVHRPCGRNTLLKDVLIASDGTFERRHVDILRESYRGQPYLDFWADWLSLHLCSGRTRLVDLTSSMIRSIMDLLDIDTRTAFASEFDTRGTSGMRLLEIVQFVQGSTYVAAPGSRDYLEDFRGFKEAGITLHYFEYQHPNYDQGTHPFVPNLSFLDAAVRVSPESLRALVAEQPSD